MSAPDRRALLDFDHGKLSIRCQCRLLGVTRSSVYRQRQPANDNDLTVMRRLDELFTAWPFLGSRRLAAMLRADGRRINRKRVQRLMRQMGIAALGPKPRTTNPAPGHKIFPSCCGATRLRVKLPIYPECPSSPCSEIAPDGRGASADVVSVAST